MQRAKDGKLHHVWEEMVDEANAVGAPAIQMVVLGAHMVVLATPEAAEVVLKKNSFVPKYSEGYSTFRFLVRTPAAHLIFPCKAVGACVHGLPHLGG